MNIVINVRVRRFELISELDNYFYIEAPELDNLSYIGVRILWFFKKYQELIWIKKFKSNVKIIVKFKD